MYVDSDSAQISVIIIFSIVIIANLVGNALVCLVITIYQDRQLLAIEYFYHYTKCTSPKQK